MRLLAFFLSVLISGCVLNEKRSCEHFSYDSALRDSVVIPFLKEKFGEGYRHFNYDDPFVSVKGSQVAYVFDSSKMIDGKMLRYEKSIYVVRGCVDGEVVEITEVGAY